MRRYLVIKNNLSIAATWLPERLVLLLILFISLFFPAIFSYGSDLKIDNSSTTIFFGARNDVAPLSFKKDTDWNGYTIDLCRRIFDNYKKDRGIPSLEMKFIPVSAAERFKALKENRIQALCGATTVTIERMRDYDFTLFTFVSGASVMKRRDTKIELLGRPVDQKKEVKVSVVEGTTTQNHIERLLGGSVKVIEKPDHAKAFDALRQKEVDFYFGDRIILRERLRQARDREDYILAPGFLSYEPYAIAVHRENHDLLHSANATLAELYRSGEIETIYERWFYKAAMSDLLRAMFELQKIPK